MVSNFINGYDNNKNESFHFDIVDYCVFGAMLLLSACTGIYYAVRARFSKKMGTTVRDYLTGSGHMKPFPVAMSLIASYVSGVTVLGSPTEIYNYGTQYWAICIAIVTSGITIMFVYLPVFFKLQVYSSYEYLEIRFDRKVRMLASILFIIDEILFLPILIYVPSLAFNQVTGVDIYIIGTVVCLICIFYTVLGGLEAVLWTDTWQIIVMFISVVVVVVLGTISYGGIDSVFDVSNQFGRIDFLNVDPSMYTRNTIFSVVFGGYVYWLSFNSVNQTMVQRYMSLSNLSKSKMAIIMFIIGVTLFISLCCYAGLLIFATYSTCDPLTSGRIIADDQLLPLFVMETVGHLRGVPGLFVAGVFGAALSSLSVILNSTSLVILEDLIKPYVKRQLTDKHEKWIVKAVALTLGTISIGFLYIVQYLGSVLEVATALSAIAAGTTFGVFTLGMVIPWSNTKGAVAGAIAGGVISGLVSFGRRYVQAVGQVSDQKLPISIEGCDHQYGIDIFTNSSVIRETSTDTSASDVFPLFRLSYHWITPIGVSTVLIVGTLVSFLTKPTDLRTLDPDLISPLSAWLLPPEAQRYAGTAIKKARNTREHEVDVVLMNDVIMNGCCDVASDIGTKVLDRSGQTVQLLGYVGHRGGGGGVDGGLSLD